MFSDAAAAAVRPPLSSAPAGKAHPVPTGSRIVDHYALTQQVHTSTSTGTELHAGRHRLTGEMVALKAFDRTASNAVGRVPLAHTTALHAQLEHEHIVRLHEVFDSQRLVHVLEWVPGLTLDEFMRSHGCGPAEAQQILQQLVGAVAHMHAVGVCHRDLRLANVMLRAGPRCCVKLIDLGSCGPADKLLSRKVNVVPVYAAPELFPGGGRGGPAVEYSGKAIDVWALGVMAHVLLTGTYPFTSEQEAREGKLRPNAAVPDSVAELLRGMLAVDRTARLSAADVLAHPWLQPAPRPASQIIASGSPAAWLRAKATAAACDGNEGAEVAVSEDDDAAAHEEVLAQLSKLGMAAQSVTDALEAGTRDEQTAAYYLLWQKRARLEAVGTDEETDGADDGTETAPASAEAADNDVASVPNAGDAADVQPISSDDPSESVHAQ